MCTQCKLILKWPPNEGRRQTACIAIAIADHSGARSSFCFAYPSSLSVFLPRRKVMPVGVLWCWCGGGGRVVGGKRRVGQLYYSDALYSAAVVVVVNTVWDEHSILSSLHFSLFHSFTFSNSHLNGRWMKEWSGERRKRMRALFLFGCKKVRASELYFLYLTVYSLFFLPFFCCAAVFKHFPISAVNLCVCLTVCLLRLLKEEGRRKERG